MSCIPAIWWNYDFWEFRWISTPTFSLRQHLSTLCTPFGAVVVECGIEYGIYMLCGMGDNQNRKACYKLYHQNLLTTKNADVPMNRKGKKNRNKCETVGKACRKWVKSENFLFDMRIMTIFWGMDIEQKFDGECKGMLTSFIKLY